MFVIHVFKAEQNTSPGVQRACTLDQAKEAVTDAMVQQVVSTGLPSFIIFVSQADFAWLTLERYFHIFIG